MEAPAEAAPAAEAPPPAPPPPPPPPAAAEPELAPPADFQSTFERLADKRLPIVGLTLQGNARTKDHIILRELRPVAAAKTLAEVKDALLESSSRLRELGVFNGVDMLLDASEEGGPGTADLVVTVKEKSVLSLHTGTYIQGEEGSVEATARLNNALGYCEQVEATVAKGSQQSLSFALSAQQLRLYGGPEGAEARLEQSTRSLVPHCSYSELVRSVVLSLTDGGSATSGLFTGAQRVDYELSWRTLSDPGHRASRSVARGLGHSLKSSLRHGWAVDARDSPHQPQSGWAARTALELAGLGPGARFLKGEAEGQIAYPLPWPQTALALTLRCGLILPWGGGGGALSSRPGRGMPGASRTYLCDRFYLGGPGSLRGFRTRGVGPSDERRPPPPGAKEGDPEGGGARDALGGDFVVSALAAVTFPIPYEPLSEVGVHGHAFVNAGTLLPMAAAVAGRRDGGPSVRTSCGVGMVFPTKLGRLEVNYCLVMRAAKGDEVRRGWQFGLRPDSL